MAEQVRVEQPFFTVGVPTFNRHELLRETLNSILAQGFADFEVIVGNDYTAEVLTGDMIGIDDPRIRFVNYPQNLREAGNMNALLEMATGRYFTWLFDDDLYEPDFLQAGHDCLTKTGYPPVFFCSYRTLVGDEEFLPRKIQTGTISEFTGREFVRRYSPYRTEMFPTFGLFDTAVMKSTVGGFDDLSNTTIALYSEYLFLVKCGLLEKIIYSDAPFYVFRQHEGSWSESNTELGTYMLAGEELIRRSSDVLRSPALVANYSENLFKVCTIHLIEFAHKLGRHVSYIPEPAQKKIGVKELLRAFFKHWQESFRTRKMYNHLGGRRSLNDYYDFLKLMIFCNYLMTSYFYHFLYRKFRPQESKQKMIIR